MTAMLSRLRDRVSYATVLSLLSALVFLGGATAFAATQLGKNSVGTKQLKKNSVTTKKIKKNAVTNAKIKKDAVNGAKIKDGSLTGAKLDSAAMSYGRIVHQAKTSGPVPAANAPVVVPLQNATYVQPAGRNDTLIGEMAVTFPAGCEDAEAFAFLLVDAPDPSAPQIFDISGYASLERPGSAQVTKRISFFPYVVPAGLAAPPSGSANHTFVVYAGGECNSGSGSISIDSVEIDVIGTGTG